MKKFTKVILAIIAVAALSLPYFVGRGLENDFNDFIAKVNETGKNDFTVTGKFYRGIFSSTATTDITFSNSYTSLQLAHYIKHGPVIFDFKGWFSPSTYIPRGIKMGRVSTQFTGKAQDFIKEIYGAKPAYECTTGISFAGDITTQFINYPLTTNIDKGTMNWQGGTLNLDTDRNMDKAKLAMHMPLLEYTESLAAEFKQVATVSNIKLDYEAVNRGAQSMYKFGVENIKLTTNDKEDGYLQGLEFNGDKKLTNDVVDLNVNAKFTKAALEQDLYGPLNLSLKVNNWKENLVTQFLTQQVDEMQPVPVNPLAPSLGTQSPSAAMTEGPNAIPIDAINKKISLQLDFNFKTPDGDIIVKIAGEIGGPEVKEVTMEQILPTLNVTENFQVSKKIVYKALSFYGESQIRNNEVEFYLKNRTSTITNPYTMTPEALQKTVNDWINNLITQLTAQNYIVQKGEDLVVDVNFANQILSINGVTKTPEDMQQLAKQLQVIQPPVVSPSTPSAPATPGITTIPLTNGAAPSTVAPAPSTVAPAPSTAPTTPPVPATSGSTTIPSTN